MPANKLSKNGVIIPDRKGYGTERVTLDPSQDDDQYATEAPMHEGKQANLLRQGYSTIPLPAHKSVDHSTASVGKDRVGSPAKETRGGNRR